MSLPTHAARILCAHLFVHVARLFGWLASSSLALFRVCIGAYAGARSWVEHVLTTDVYFGIKVSSGTHIVVDETELAEGRFNDVSTFGMRKKLLFVSRAC